MSTAEATETTLTSLIKEAAAKHRDVEVGIDWVLAQTAPPLESTQHILFDATRRGLREMIHDARHQERTAIKRGPVTGANGTPQPCTRNTADALGFINDIAKDALMDLAIGKMRLGDMTGEELAIVASSEGEISKGHLRNQKFYAKVAARTPKGKHVRDAWTNKRLRKLWESVQ